jgi:hypothetical protein
MEDFVAWPPGQHGGLQFGLNLFPSPTGFRCSSTNYQLHNPTSFRLSAPLH